MGIKSLTRRLVILVATALIAIPTVLLAQPENPEQSVTRPVISETVSPLISISPIASDGNAGNGFLRKPPGKGPFPTVVLLHGGMVQWETKRLRDFMFVAHASRWLEAGYVTVAITYRSRDADPQTKEPLKDALAAIDYIKQYPFVDADSIVIRGTSGGGDLALEVVTSTDVAAIAAEEPASMVFLGMFNTSTPKKSELYTAKDSVSIMKNADSLYTEEFQELTRAKIAKINTPILIFQSNTNPLPAFNEKILIPELRAAGKDLTTLFYPDQPHSFAYYSLPHRTPNPAVALQVFNDVEKFFRKRVSVKPRQIDSKLVQHVPW